MKRLFENYQELFEVNAKIEEGRKIYHQKLRKSAETAEKNYKEKEANWVSNLKHKADTGKVDYKFNDISDANKAEDAYLKANRKLNKSEFKNNRKVERDAEAEKLWKKRKAKLRNKKILKAGKVAGGVALAAGAAYGAKKLHDKKKKKKNISESYLFENYQNLNEFSLNPFKRKSNIHHAEKYFNKTLKKAAKGKASSGDVDRARRTLMSLKKPKS
jgi:hypothetical protein